MSSDLIILTSKDQLKSIILSGQFDNSIQVKNNEHICKDGSIFDYSSIIDFSFIFSDCFDLVELPLLDTSNVSNMKNAFSNCSNLKFIPLLDTSNVTDFFKVFWNCSSLEHIPNFSTKKSTNLNYALCYCILLPIHEKIKFYFDDFTSQAYLNSSKINSDIFSKYENFN
jgi:hypothetical protein